MQTDVKICLSCGKAIQGRVDKKFCDDYCRNTYNNQSKAFTNNLVRNINSTLKKNRNIMSSLLGENGDTTKTTREKMLQMGFQFKYTTHSYTNKKGNLYGYCYDYGYLELENGWFLIVKDRENS